MNKFRIVAIALTGALALAACGAPAPTSDTVIYAEPVISKYGTIVPGTNEICRPQSQPISSAFPPSLPICESMCPAGTVAQLSTVSDVRQLVCVRVPERVPENGGSDRDDEPRTPQSQNDPTRG